MSKFFKIFLLIYNFIFILFLLTNTFDFDLGWHLRFGKEWLETGVFSYLDSYTYSHLGQLWINHEWGGDLLWWFLYANIGYFAIIFLTTLLILGAFFIAQKAYNKYTLSAVFVTTFLIWANYHIFAPRLSMFSLLFFALILYSLQNIEKNKFYRFWPLLFWIWAALHGSFTLGFITIGIYFIGNLLNSFFIRYYPKLSLGKSWNKKTYREVIIWTVLSLLVILINPYGWNLYKETISYFFYDFYKTHIIEWVNSFTFPIYWKTGLYLAPALVAIFWNVKKKIFSWAELLLFIGLFYISLKYKRQAIYFALLCQPLFTSFVEKATDDINKNWSENKFFNSKKIKVMSFVFGTFILIYLSALYIPKIKIYKDIWPNIKQVTNQMPVDAIDFLNTKLSSTTYKKVFNEFGFGAYMNWVAPQALIFLDGRGPATWKISDDKTTSFEIYYDLIYNDNGLQEVEKQKVHYIILENRNNYKPRIDSVNRLLFSPLVLKKITEISQTTLEKSLKSTKNWQLIYTDNKANIWEFISTTPPEITSTPKHL